MMTQLPDEVVLAIAEATEPGILTTADKAGVPNAAYMALRKVVDCESLIFADAHLGKTRSNIVSGSSGSFLLLDVSRHKSYQIKGRLEYVTDGPLYEEIRARATPGHPAVAAVVLHAEEIYRGADRLT